jgi:hypothetical protein
MDHNAVKSPKHYTEGRRFEPKDVIRDWGLNFNLGSALKYIARAGRKGNIVEDLEKAREYLAFEIEALRAEKGATPDPKADVNKPHFKEKADEGMCCGVIELEVPRDMPLEAVIQMAIEKIGEDLGK